MHLKWKVLLSVIWLGLAAIITFFTAGLGSIVSGVMVAIWGFVLFLDLVYHFAWKPFKNFWIICGKIDIYVIYMLIRLPIWLFIQLPLYYLFTGSHKIEEFFQNGLYYFFHEPKKTAAATLPGVALMLFLFPPRYLDPLAAESWTNYASTIFILMVGAFMSGFILMKLYDKLSGGHIAQKKMPGSAVDTPGETLHGTAQRYGNWKQTQKQQVRETGAAAKRNAHRAEKAHHTYHHAKWIVELFSSILELLGLSVGTMGAGLIILTAILLIIGVFLLQFFIVMFFFITFIKGLIPLVAGPLLEAMGLGQAYTSFFGGSLLNQYAVGIDIMPDNLAPMVAEAGKKVECAFQGPECLAAWRMNQTQKPDAQDVGENYELKIQDFRIGSGSQLDVAYQPRHYQIPISFTLYNTRRGFKGIPAHNVSYRVKMMDFDNQEKDPYCDTGWVPVDGYNIRKDRAEKPYKGNDLPPGGYATTEFLRLSDDDTPGDGFTIQDCGMLQPGIKSFRQAKLTVKYDYSSSAHLYFEGMSREASSETKKVDGKTTDTPVTIDTAIQSPITYDQKRIDEADEAVQPRTLQLSFDTDKKNAQYQVKGFELTKSSDTCIFNQKKPGCASNSELEKQDSSNSKLSCIFRPEERGSDELRLTDRARKNFIAPYEGSERSKDFWYTKQRPPTFMGCPLGLEEPSTVNPEGQSFYMKAEANYTVQLEKPLEGFKVLNTRCRTQNCPLLIPESLVPEDMDENAKEQMKHKCEGAMGEDGCSVGDPGEDWTSVSDITIGGQIDDGEKAFTWENISVGDWKGFKEMIGMESGGFPALTRERSIGFRKDSPRGIGLDMEEIQKEGGKALYLSSSGGRIQSVGVKDIPDLCHEYSNPSPKGWTRMYRDAWQGQNLDENQNLLFFWPKKTANGSCGTTFKTWSNDECKGVYVKGDRGTYFLKSPNWDDIRGEDACSGSGANDYSGAESSAVVPP